MAKRSFAFFNEDGEREMTMDLDKGQQELLQFLQDWGYIADAVNIQDMGEVCNYPPYADCPECGKTCVFLNGVGHEAEYWCDECGLDFIVEV